MSSSDHPADDSLLILAARAGDQAAYCELVLRHQGTVRAFLLTRLSQKHDAEDLAQETFLTAWRRMADFEVASPFAPWLRGIAEKLLMNHLRKHRETPIGGSEALQEVLESIWQSESMPEEESARAIALGECLHKIDGPSRLLLRERYVEGKTLPELCQQSGRKHSSVTMQLHRLRQLLADCVQRKLSASSV